MTENHGHREAELRELMQALQICLSLADKLGLGMVGIFLNSAIDYLGAEIARNDGEPRSKVDRVQAEGCPMAVTAQFSQALSDPLLAQVERIFYQRKSRYELIDRDVLGEPGWDILLCTYMVQRRELACDLGRLATEIGLRLETTMRWVAILAQRNLLIQQDNIVALSDEAEMMLSKMFMEQIREVSRAIAQAADRPGEANSNKS